MGKERGDLAVGRKFNFRNHHIYACQHGIDTRKMLKQVIKQEKEWCERSIFLAIQLHNLIEYDVEVDDNYEVTIHARLRGVVPPEKMEDVRRQSNEESNK